MKIKQNVLISFLIVMVIVNLSILFQENSFVRRVLWRVLITKDPAPLLLVTATDEIFRQHPPEGNIFLKFKGFDKSYEHKNYASIIFFRINYALYPKRVFACEKGRKIIRGFEFIESPFEPDEKWFSDNGVSDIIIFSRDDSGRISYTGEKTK